MIGSLLYLCASRPDIMLSVCMCARFQANPKEVHLRAVKRIMRYLVYTPKFGLWYPKGSTFDLIGYSDADYARCQIDRKSTSGTCQFLGRSLVSWASKKTKSSSLSTVEAEYIAAGHCCAQLLWMRQTLRDYGYKLSKVPLLCDNESAIGMADNPVEHRRTKHIVKGKCALGPFLSILVIECQHKCLNVNLCSWMDKVQIKSKGMFLSLSTLVLCTNILV
jgi:hypothetical protein